jgi:RNA polymerase sigma-70 factor (ECF subfamily)
MTDANVPSYREEDVGDLSSSLLLRVRAQDQVAWRRLVRLYTPLVYRWCRASGLQPADAADIGQEVFRAVARKIDAFRKDQAEGSFRRWLRVITRNKITDHHRRMPVDVPGDSGAQTLLQQLPDEEPDAAADTEETGLLLGRALELMRAEFEERTWQAFWQTAIDGASAAEVAVALGMTPNAVYLAKARVRRRLREELGDLEPI